MKKSVMLFLILVTSLTACAPAEALATATVPPTSTLVPPATTPIPPTPIPFALEAALAIKPSDVPMIAGDQELPLPSIPLTEVIEPLASINEELTYIKDIIMTNVSDVASVDYYETRDGIWQAMFVPRDGNGNMKWSKIWDRGWQTGQSAIYFTLNEQGIVDGINKERIYFRVIPNSKDASIVWGDTGSGENLEPIIVKHPVTLEDGREVYALYFDKEANQWRIVPELMNDSGLVVVGKQIMMLGNEGSLNVLEIEGATEYKIIDEYLTAVNDKNEELAIFDEANQEWVDVRYRSCFDPELIAKVGANFEKETGMTIDEAYEIFSDKYEANLMISAYDKTQGTHLWRFMFLGGTEFEVSVGHITGMKEDVVVCAYGLKW